MRNRNLRSQLVTLTLVGVLAVGFAGTFTPWAVQFLDVQPGDFAAGDPYFLLGPPEGGGQFVGSTDVYQLGVRGSVVLELGAHALDGPGTDLIVYENPFNVTGDPLATFVECLFVEVSSDGVSWARFPTRYTGEAGPFLPGGFMAGVLTNWYRGFAGVMWAWADPSLGNEPFDVVGGGGDAFDLADLLDHPDVVSGEIDLDDIRFVRLIDVQGGVDVDGAGSVVWDAGHPAFSCADVDAVAAVNNQVDNSGTAGRPAVELSIQQFQGNDYLFLSVSDTNGLWTIEQHVTASGDGFGVNFYADLLPFFVLIQVDAESATLAAGPIPPDLFPVLLKIGVEDISGRFAGDAIYLP